MELQAQTLDDYVAAFEKVRRQQVDTDLRPFLPKASDPLYQPVLRELVRVDLEFGWEEGTPRPLNDYQSLFPDLFADPQSLQEIAYEEYRLRRQAGQNPSPQEYAERYGLDTTNWPANRGQAADALLDSIQLEKVAKSFRAFHLEASVDGSIRLDDWRPPSGAGAEVARLFRDLHHADHQAAEALARGLGELPQVGDQILDFKLLVELGRGAFGRVFLARQSALADRPVALKIAADVAGESAALAQLQHTHIVPIYSVHRSGSLQAVCMPFAGSTTLADVITDLAGSKELPRTGLDLLRVLTKRVRPEGVPPPALIAPPVRKRLSTLNYPEAALWLAGRLADGLAHASERGILHRDVKPANVLLADDGTPMLLDFNIAEDVKQRGASAALLGGTLPYMAPELLSAFQAGHFRAVEVDARADLYSLGIVLFELLTGKFPFSPVRLPPGPARSPTALEGVLVKMVAERQLLPSCPRKENPAVSPAVASIVRHLLEPDPKRRYQSPRELQEDVERHLEHLPLRHAQETSPRERVGKWIKRHPRAGLYASLVGGLLLLLLAGGLGWRANTLSRAAEAQQALTEFRKDFPEVQFLIGIQPENAEQQREGVRRARQALERHGVLTTGWRQGPLVRPLPEGEKQKLVEDMGDLLLALSRATALLPDSEPTEAEVKEALRYNLLAGDCFPTGKEPGVLWGQRAQLLQKLEDEKGAEAARAEVVLHPAESARDLRLSARELMGRKERQYKEARRLLEKSLAKAPDNYWSWWLLGRASEVLGDDARAVNCFTTCTALAPDFPRAYLNRGLAHLRLKDFRDAVHDLTEAIRADPSRSQTYFDRALARERLGDLKGALLDLEEAVNHGLPDTRLYFHRSRLRGRLGDAEGAQKDRAEGLRLTPSDELSWIARGMARLANRDPKGALADLDKALEINPTSRAALQNKAHIFSEHLQDHQGSRKILDRVIALYPDYVPALVGQAVLLARLGEREESLELAQNALERDSSGQVCYQAACAYALTSCQVPADGDTAMTLLRQAIDKHYGLDLLDSDDDLAPLCGRPDFQKLLTAASLLHPRGGGKQ